MFVYLHGVLSFGIWFFKQDIDSSLKANLLNINFGKFEVDLNCSEGDFNLDMIIYTFHCKLYWKGHSATKTNCPPNYQRFSSYVRPRIFLSLSWVVFFVSVHWHTKQLHQSQWSQQNHWCRPFAVLLFLKLISLVSSFFLVFEFTAPHKILKDL